MKLSIHGTVLHCWQCVAVVYCSISDYGFTHILCHYGGSRAEVYRRIFQVLWFGSKIGSKDCDEGTTPTYVYPVDLRESIRSRFPDNDAGKRDEEFASAEKKTHSVTWDELRGAKWPCPPKGCAICRASMTKPKPY